MAEFENVPALLNIRIKKGDFFSVDLDFDIVLTGYTFESKIMTADEATLVKAITVTETDLSAGKINLSVSAANMALLSKGRFFWYLKWTSGGNVRTVMAGEFLIK